MAIGKKKTVGLILEEISVDYSRDIIHSVMNAVNAMNTRNIELVVIAGKQYVEDENGNRKPFNDMYNSVYGIMNSCHFDGLLITLPNCKDRRNYEKLIFNRHEEVPKVFISSDVQDEVTVTFDNETGINEAVDYLVRAKGFTKFCMLGGRDDNGDAVRRKDLYVKALGDNAIEFDEETQFVSTDMSINTREEARILLKNNPDCEAIFCVNDQVAVGLYEVMKERSKIPGKDILIFGFDNTILSGNMVPPLASIGSDSITLGQKALELLIRMMNGNPVESAVIPTRLYGKESLDYANYVYTTKEVLEGKLPTLNKMFDDCFYRYRNEQFTRNSVDLRRLFIELIRSMIEAMNMRYMSQEKFDELGRMIDVLFESGIMKYTDITKLTSSINKLQNTMNFNQQSLAANVMNNRLFLRMKDRAIRSMAESMITAERRYYDNKTNMQRFIVESMDFGNDFDKATDRIIRNFDKLGIRNAAFYMFTKPIVTNGHELDIPNYINLCCVVKEGELYVLPKDRRLSSITRLFLREELTVNRSGLAAFPVFCRNIAYGFLICELDEGLSEKGELIATRLGMALCINDRRI